MNVEIGAEAALFPEKEYISGISLQCEETDFKSDDLLFDVQRAARTRWLSECRTSTPPCWSPRSAWSASPARSEAWSRIWESTSPCSGILFFLFELGLIVFRAILSYVEYYVAVFADPYSLYTDSKCRFF